MNVVLLKIKVSIVFRYNENNLILKRFSSVFYYFILLNDIKCAKVFLNHQKKRNLKRFQLFLSINNTIMIFE